MKRVIALTLVSAFALMGCGGRSGADSGGGSGADSGDGLARQACSMYKTADAQYQADRQAFFAKPTDSAAASKIDSVFREKLAAAADVAAMAAVKDNKWDALNQALRGATNDDVGTITADCAKATTTGRAPEASAATPAATQDGDSTADGACLLSDDEASTLFGSALLHSAFGPTLCNYNQTGEVGGGPVEIRDATDDITNRTGELSIAARQRCELTSIEAEDQRAGDGSNLQIAPLVGGCIQYPAVLDGGTVYFGGRALMLGIYPSPYGAGRDRVRSALNLIATRLGAKL